MSKSSGAGGALKSKSPAEFFAEHQNIAGFDNPGKSLYTTIREFVENSLDAAEAIRALPLIELRIEKLTTAEFNKLRGVEKHIKADMGLYEKEKPKKSKKATTAAAAAAAGTAADGEANGGAEKDEEEDEDDKGSMQYFRVTCRDNGGGMSHDQIPSMLGVVLSSTKYGVKQTRGKFGLGAKMALVWAMKSTGLPICVQSATSRSKPVSSCKLFIDIHRNAPDVLAHTQRANEEGWQGTEISVVIGGKWKTYQSKIVNYMRQLAVITPYAEIQLEFNDHENESKSWRIDFARRTDVMPHPPLEVKHHPSSVDNLLVEQLIHQSKPGTTLKNFLKSSFSSISAPLAERLVDELGGEFFPEMDVREIGKQQIHQITRLLRSAKFAPPDPACLSPAGEYNLRLGIMKELNPEFVATASQPADVHEGHPFLVEAAVSLGGAKSKPGISVYRYANRIPLLFEGSNDVASVVANRDIRWSSYKLHASRDRISVFVSLVSTKVPFKGTSKEYIGDDKANLHECIRRAINQCCAQIKKRLVAAEAAREKADRKKQMARYIPDVSRALMAVLAHMASAESSGAAMLQPAPPVQIRGVKRKREEEEQEEANKRYAQLIDKLNISDKDKALCSSLVSEVSSGVVSEELLEERLYEHVDSVDAELSMGAEGDDDGEGAMQLFIGGIDTSNVEIKQLYGEDFKITLW